MMNNCSAAWLGVWIVDIIAWALTVPRPRKLTTFHLLYFLSQPLFLFIEIQMALSLGRIRLKLVQQLLVCDSKLVYLRLQLGYLRLKRFLRELFHEPQDIMGRLLLSTNQIGFAG